MIESRVTTRVATTIDASAEIVGFADGSPVRLRRNGCLVKPMGLDMSVKIGDHVPWESRNEQHAFWHAEMHPGVVRYSAQPHTLYLTIDDRRASYTPDMLIEGAEGSLAVIEVKDTFEEAKDPDYTAKLQQAALIYASLGWVLKVVTMARRSGLERASIRTGKSSRGRKMIVARRQTRKGYVVSRRDNQAMPFMVARAAGLPGPFWRAIAARRR